MSQEVGLDEQVIKDTRTLLIRIEMSLTMVSQSSLYPSTFLYLHHIPIHVLMQLLLSTDVVCWMMI